MDQRDVNREMWTGAGDGAPVGPGEAAPGCPELHYVARRATA